MGGCGISKIAPEVNTQSADEGQIKRISSYLVGSQSTIESNRSSFDMSMGSIQQFPY